MAYGMSEKVEDDMFRQYFAEEEQVWTTYEGFRSNVYYFDIFDEIKYRKIWKRVHEYDYFSAPSHNRRLLGAGDLSPACCSIFGVILPRMPRSQESTSLIPTPSTICNLQRIATAFLEDKSLLLQGQPGCGKMFLLTEMIRHIGRYEDIVHIHLGDQTDGKLLLGAYVSGSQPGEFKWQPGTLTKAIQQGLIVIIEDIQTAQNDILSILLPILERRQIYIPDQNKSIDAHTGFRLIATDTLTNSRKNTTSVGSKRWHRIELETMDDDELITMLGHKFPLIAPLSRLCLKVFRSLQTYFADQAHLRSVDIRPLTIRDLVKFSKRVTSTLRLYKLEVNENSVPERIYDFLFLEAFEIYLGFLSKRDELKRVAVVLGAILQFSQQKIEELLERNIGTIKESETTIQIGRAVLQRGQQRPAQRKPFAYTKHSFEIIERAAIAVSQSEPLLLVGETGVGKTAAIQELAHIVGKKLVSINMSQQTEGNDLLGGFKPVEPITVAFQLEDEFDTLFEKSFSLKRNEKFLKAVKRARRGQKWSALAKHYRDAVKMAHIKFSHSFSNLSESSLRKRLKKDANEAGLITAWDQFAAKVDLFAQHIGRKQRAFTFTFVEGILIRAIKRGDWVLLDEVNLAPPDTLDVLNSLLKEEGSVTISERGDLHPIKAHQDFRLFANMNPSTDVGKRDLPRGIRSRYTEYYVRSLDEDKHDLVKMVEYHLNSVSLNDLHVSNDVATLYIDIKHLNDEYHLADGQGSKPEYSVRNLSRALTFATNKQSRFGLRQALYEGFFMCFATTLNSEGQIMLKNLLVHKLLSSPVIHLTNTTSTSPDGSLEAVFPPFSIPFGPLSPESILTYVLTPSINQNLLNLVRCIMDGRFPILLQGPTSSGKTSLINYLARTTGHKFVRINNHEQTDLQEYLGSYVSDETGHLKFQDGLLVQALRHGYWIVLDELNLAPSDVLEALNRLLDDNRELLIPETQELITPHPSFMLFATQNPHGMYAGRKPLSRALRNRFLELHFDDIPETELRDILHQKCKIPKSYATKIVEAFKVAKFFVLTIGLMFSNCQIYDKAADYSNIETVLQHFEICSAGVGDKLAATANLRIMATC